MKLKHLGLPTLGILAVHIPARLGSCCILLLMPLSAYASPITFYYRVDVTTRCVSADDVSTCAPYLTSFPLSMSFEPEILLERNTPLAATRQFSPPTFSAIPLVLPDVLPGATTTGFAFLSNDYDYFGDRYIQSAIASQRTFLTYAGVEYQWALSLSDSRLVPSINADLTPEAFGALLGSGNDTFGRAFVFGFTTHHTDLGSTGYSGSVVEIDPPTAIPEPGSMFLVVSGMAGMAVQRWWAIRRRKPSA